jgi:hypothetical protein
MNKKQIRAIETLKAAADNARKIGLTEHQIDLIMEPDVKISSVGIAPSVDDSKIEQTQG